MPGDLLVRCLRRDPDPGTPDVLAALSDVAWSRLVDAAEWHGVGPLLGYRLRAFRRLEVPDAARARLRDLYDHCLVRNLAIEAQLAEILAAMAGSRHDVLVLKGAVLARVAYEDPALRPMYDLDLLARPDEADAAYAVLQGLGYRPAALRVSFSERHHLHPLAREDGVSVELHRALAPIDTPVLRDLSGLWDRAQRTSTAGVALPHLAPDDGLLHLCVHAACNHALDIPLLTICDIDTLVARTGDAMPWSRLVRTANAAGAGRFVYVLLRASETLLGTPIPPDVPGALTHEADDEDIAADLVEHLSGASGDVPVMVSNFMSAPSAGARIAAIWRGVFPRVAQLRSIYGLAPHSRVAPAFYLVRPFDLVIRRGAWLLGMLVGSRRTVAALAHDRRRARARAWARGAGDPQDPPVG